MWIVSTETGALEQIAAEGKQAVPSPDGTRIAFLRGGSVVVGTSINVMDRSNRSVRTLLELPDGEVCTNLAWSPNGNRLAWLQRTSGTDRFSVESVDLQRGHKQTLISDSRVRAFTWGRNSTLLYARAEDPPNERGSNLWEVFWDERSGKISDQPTRLTDWTGFLFYYLSSSESRRRIAFVRWRWQSDVHMAELAEGPRLVRMQRLTRDERTDWVGAWYADSDSVIFCSDRSGTADLFIQSVAGTEPKVIASGPAEQRDPALSPDGKSILYFEWPQTGVSGPGRIMRVPVHGGTPEPVLEVDGRPTGLRGAEDVYMIAATAHPAFRCPANPQSQCVLSERQSDEARFSLFHPITGVRRPLFSVALKNRNLFWDVAPSGMQIVYGFEDRIRSVLHVVRLTGETIRDVRVDGWRDIQSVSWAPDAQGFYATAWASRGSPLLYVGMNGDANLLYRAGYHLTRAFPSRDGKRIMFTESTSDSNAWVIDDGPPVE